MNKQPEQLKLEADQYLENIKLYASHWGKALLIGGGSIFLAVKVIKAISKKKNKLDDDIEQLQKKQYAIATTTKSSSRIFKLILQQISIFLIAIAKQKLSETLNRRNLSNGK